MAGNSATAAAAIPPSQRLDLLDGLRGFALLGILLANIWYWVGWDFMTQAQMIAQVGPDWERGVRLFHRIVIDGKFYTLFSLMFGIGFTLQLDRLERRGAAGARVFRRRMLVLLAIGLVHMSLIWAGDILTLYAALGLLLPLFRHARERTLLLLAAALLLSPLLLAPLFDALGWAPWRWFYRLAEAVGCRIDAHCTPDPLAQFQRPDWTGFLAFTAEGLPSRIAMLLEVWRLPKVLGIMLLGMAAGRRVIDGTLLADRALLRRLFVGGLVIGLPFTLLYALAPAEGQQGWAAVIGTAPQGIAYAAGFALLWPRAQGLLRPLVPVGRMALTSYLTHSAIGFFFAGRFLGLAGHLPPWDFYPLALAIFAGQLLFSRWWLAHHEQGPMERLWRIGTYGRGGAHSYSG
ncbi:MAG: DUF418 domain-containing protein [Sphingomonadales bacterium]|nr:DUF418 domain-containing protein [Sphingomonadales bacterium]